MSKNKIADAVFNDENPPAEAEAKPAAPKTSLLDKKLIKHSILIAEDDADLQEALAITAEERKFRVVRASDGLEALTKAQNQAFSAILIDMNLPKKLGHEVVAQIREHGPSQKSVIVVLSGYLKKEVIEALAGKVDKAFTKPADIDAILDAVTALVEKKTGKTAA